MRAAQFFADNVALWLCTIELPQLAAIFKRSSIDGDMLVTLTDQDMLQMGVASFMHRRKVLKKLRKRLKQNQK